MLSSTTGRSRRRIRWLRRAKGVGFAIAAMPICQLALCPDPAGALNFELQQLVNSVLINTVDIILRNILNIA